LKYSRDNLDDFLPDVAIFTQPNKVSDIIAIFMEFAVCENPLQMRHAI